MNKPVLSNSVHTAIEIAIYLALIFVILYWCVQIVSPFIPFILWGTVIAVAMYAPFQKLRKKLGGNNKLAVTVFIVLGLTIIILPSWMFTDSLIGSAQAVRSSLESGQFTIPPAHENVKEWPVVGEKLYQNWSDAASNFEEWLETHHEQVRTILERATSGAAGIGFAILQFILATIIAGAMLANSESAVTAVRRYFYRLVSDRTDEVLDLATATIRSVAVGVLGIAFIQAVAGGAGMMIMGIPGAGLWALFILILAIAQLPPLLVLLPAIIYVFSTNDSTTAAVIFTVWSVLVSFSDAILKPMFLGRGVEAPMPVILLGAIGGLIYAGFIGLFLGAVILALGYQLLTNWLKADEPQPSEDG